MEESIKIRDLYIEHIGLYVNIKVFFKFSEGFVNIEALRYLHLPDTDIEGEELKTIMDEHQEYITEKILRVKGWSY